MEAGKHNLPQRIYHLAHPRPDVLVLRRYPAISHFDLSSNCKICLNKFKNGDYIYACDDKCSRYYCDFTVDIPCSSITAAIDFGGHEHLLFFVKRVDPSRPRECHSCWEYTSELMLRCVQLDCGYTLHLSCGPLPVTIRYHHSGHELTLTLMDSLLDGADPKDSWCDICEERRDPRKCVYRSENPPFTATIDCLLPQIVGALQGDHGDVRLRTVRGHILGNVVEDNVDFTFHGEDSISSKDETLFDSLPEEDKELMECVFTEIEKTLGKDKDADVITFKFSDEAFEQFKEHAIAITGKVNFSQPTAAHLLEEKGRFVKVGSNFVYRELVPLYHQLIDKQGDFTAGCPLSPVGKARILTFLLMLIQGTQGLQICEITDGLLVSLQFYLETLSGKLGFDVQFVRDNLEKIACAIYALKFVKTRDDITADLTQNIEQLERDIPEDKPKIDALREQYGRGKESAFVKQCLAEASALKWKNAGELLGLDQVE